MPWRRRVNLVLLGVLIASVGLGVGCTVEKRHKILVVVFDDVPPPGKKRVPKPYIRQPRRPPAFKPASPQLVRVKKYKPAFEIDWKTLYRQLPKDSVGGIDWVTALNDDAIQPAAGIDAEHAQEQPELSLDIQLAFQDQPLFTATFPHKPHTELLSCASCHPKIFQMKAGADPINMQKIYAGEYCGECHGKVAFDPMTGCPRCHLALAGSQ